MKLIGEKTNRIYKEFISNYIPSNIDEYIYIEPFGGTFNISTFLDKKPQKLIYNDINKYNFDIKSDEYYNLDYKEIFKKYNTENCFYFLDPPYYGKENIYGLKRNDIEFHINLKNELDKLPCKFLLSYNNSNFILKLYEDYNIYYYTGKHFSLKHEVLISNYSI